MANMSKVMKIAIVDDEQDSRSEAVDISAQYNMVPEKRMDSNEFLNRLSNLPKQSSRRQQ